MIINLNTAKYFKLGPDKWKCYINSGITSYFKSLLIEFRQLHKHKSL